MEGLGFAPSKMVKTKKEEKVKSYPETGTIVLSDVFVTRSNEHADDGGRGVELGHPIPLHYGPVATIVRPCGEPFEDHACHAV